MSTHEGEEAPERKPHQKDKGKVEKKEDIEKDKGKDKDHDREKGAWEIPPITPSIGGGGVGGDHDDF